MKPTEAAGDQPTVIRAVLPEAGATQAVTVVQPAAAAASTLLTTLEGWAGAVIAVAAVIALIYKLFTRDVSRDVAQLEHKVRNHGGRLDAIEHLRTADIERIVKVEASIQAFEKGLDRVERTLNDRFDDVIISIREVRRVSPRD